MILESDKLFHPMNQICHCDILKTQDDISHDRISDKDQHVQKGRKNKQHSYSVILKKLSYFTQNIFASYSIKREYTEHSAYSAPFISLFYDTIDRFLRLCSCIFRCGSSCHHFVKCQRDRVGYARPVCQRSSCLCILQFLYERLIR